jgi:hypothetical protein
MKRCAQLVVLLVWQAGTLAQAPAVMTSLTSSDTFANAQISQAEQTEIFELLEKNTVDWDRGRAPQLRVRRVFLTSGKKDGLAVLSTAPDDCGATGNCFFMVLQQRENRWRVVLHETAIEGFRITTQMHHGLYDVELSGNDSAESSSLFVMAFDGTEYHFSHCFHVNEQGGTKRRTSVPCPEEGTE